MSDANSPPEGQSPPAPRVLPAQDETLRAAVFALLSNSYEAYQLIGPSAKPAAEHDIYDAMMMPLWRAVHDAYYATNKTEDRP